MLVIQFFITQSQLENKKLWVPVIIVSKCLEIFNRIYMHTLLFFAHKITALIGIRIVFNLNCFGFFWTFKLLICQNFLTYFFGSYLSMTLKTGISFRFFCKRRVISQSLKYIDEWSEVRHFWTMFYQIFVPIQK